MSLLAFILLIVSVVTHTFEYTHYVVLPLLVITFGLLSTPILSSIGSFIGDLSYGIYLYGFPVQQTLMSFHTFNQSELMIYSLGISIILAYLSWHIIEKNALRLKNIF
jgi:peptidoglycan/LPS O-acetylase OafA/YrhL